MSMFGEEITGGRAAELGIAWGAVAEDAVEPLALELAHRGGADPPLSRATIPVDAHRARPARAALAGRARDGARAADVVAAPEPPGG